LWWNNIAQAVDNFAEYYTLMLLNGLYFIHYLHRSGVRMETGLRLRQIRERLGLTYRDVERASQELASRRGRPDFILHISRLADIENHCVVPGIHKIYTLAAVYHLDPLQILAWYDVPLNELFVDGAVSGPPNTHLAAPPIAMRTPIRFDPAFDPRRTEFLSRMVQQWGRFEGALDPGEANYRYGYVGLTDRRMAPILRPGSIVLLDVSARGVEETEWATEYDRPLYFVDVRNGYRCGWFHQDRLRLTMQPHPLSHCAPEFWPLPEGAEVIGRVVGVVTRLNEPWNIPAEESPAARAYSNRKAL
jgi:transcriptional regulator with XRE-family HTH domain